MWKTMASAFSTWESNRQVFPLAGAGGYHFSLLLQVICPCAGRPFPLETLVKVPCNTCKRKMQSLGLRSLVFSPELCFCLKNLLAGAFLRAVGRPLGRRKSSLPSSRPGGPLLFLRGSLGPRKRWQGTRLGERVRQNSSLLVTHWFPHSFHSGVLLMPHGLCRPFPGYRASQLCAQLFCPNFCPFVFVFKIPSFQNVGHSAGLLESPHLCLGKFFFPLCSFYSACVQEI